MTNQATICWGWKESSTCWKHSRSQPGNLRCMSFQIQFVWMFGTQQVFFFQVSCSKRDHRIANLNKKSMGCCVMPTPWKINMEPTNHPFRKDNDLPNFQTSTIVFHVNLPGCIIVGRSMDCLWATSFGGQVFGRIDRSSMDSESFWSLEMVTVTKIRNIYQTTRCAGPFVIATCDVFFFPVCFSSVPEPCHSRQYETSTLSTTEQAWGFKVCEALPMCQACQAIRLAIKLMTILRRGKRWELRLWIQWSTTRKDFALWVLQMWAA